MLSVAPDDARPRGHGRIEADARVPGHHARRSTTDSHPHCWIVGESRTDRQRTSRRDRDYKPETTRSRIVRMLRDGQSEFRPAIAGHACGRLKHDQTTLMRLNSRRYAFPG